MEKSCLTCGHFVNYEEENKFTEWVKKEKIPIRIEELDIQEGYIGYCDTFDRLGQRLYMTEEAAETGGLAQKGECYLKCGVYKYLQARNRAKAE